MMRRHGIHLLLAAAAALFLAFPARVLECDAVIYASAAIHGGAAASTDAGHLGFGLLELAAAACGGNLSPPLSPIYILRYLSIAAAVAGMYALFHMLLAAGVYRRAAAWYAAVIGFSYSYWHFALQAESHIISACLLVFFLREMILLLDDHKPGVPEPARFPQSISVRRAPARTEVFIRAGLLLGAATLMHQKNILLFPVAAAAIALRFDRRASAPGLARFSISYLISAVLPYLAIGFWVRDIRTVTGFREWIMGLSTWGGWGNWRATSLPAAIVGFARSIVGSHYLLGFDVLESFAVRLFPGASLQDELAVANAVPPWGRALLIPLHAIALIAFVLMLIRAWRGFEHPRPGSGALRFFTLGWLVVFGVFFIWWAPERAEFWMDLLPPLILLAALPGRVPEVRFPRIPTHALLAVSLACVNFFGSIHPQSLGRLEPETTAAVALDASLNAGDLLVSDSMLEGRAARYAGSFERVNLLDAAAGTEPADSAQRALSLVDSLLATDMRGAERPVYIATIPILSSGPNADRYRLLVGAVSDAFILVDGPSVRSNVRINRITGRSER